MSEVDDRKQRSAQQGFCVMVACASDKERNNHNRTGSGHFLHPRSNPLAVDPHSSFRGSLPFPETGSTSIEKVLWAMAMAMAMARDESERDKDKNTHI